ncbi:Pre-mRNA splicing factor PRP21 like protein-domain-containing protein [Kockovaella imperatae]|uniref:Pre-mRNA splicing factor PRP21 like protein-domain-containing protein n=1 Tax=Kockovaella imperatae TaxID=4999 RepID=A0A1Y1UHC2_9TREE|nr:Pre-mRNA splicing factor PRP21 like protein-domain-containing protein [Kockovaella imperatae]ORX36927.1 Pre-mRNA splicing factor PRP21 like protein-domain-containing protein [Kockovaella imperatae]
MATLNLPKPVNSYAGEDELRNVPNGGSSTAKGNGVNGHAEDDADMGEYRPPKPSDKLKAGMIYPPREIRAIIDKTANHISKSPTPLLLEEKIRESQKTDPKFAFLNDEDPYHQYYRYMIEVIREGGIEAIKPSAAPAAPQLKKEEQVTAYEPKPFEFKVDLPGVTAMDLDILRLTALFHARRGRSFLSSLSVREGRNYQFDFLRPTHSLYGYYNRMVESYTKIMQPPPGLIEGLIKEASDPEAKWKTLEEARNRAEWERGRRKREGEEAKEKEEEQKAFAAIDWQDFVVVETIEFTQNDVELDLPPPTSSEKLKSMSMAEKRMASMVMEEPGAEMNKGGFNPSAAADGAAVEEMDMEDEEEEEARLQRIKAEQEQARARDIQKAAMAQKGVKIRSDYVPKGLQKSTSVATQKCPYCGQMIAESELTEHIRIELLDPKWKEQKRQLEMRRTQAQQLQQGADVTASLRNLASARTDLFGDDMDEEARKQKEKEDKARRKEREKLGWDGHISSAQKTTDTFQSQFNLDDQIKKIHSRSGVADGPQGPTAGPQAGPGIMPYNHPPALAASLPNGGSTFSGATISAGPTGPSQREYVSYDPGFTQASVPSSSSGPSVHPSRMAQMGPGGPVAGQVHPREDEAPKERPVFKRPKIEKLPYGQLYSEIDWMSLHPDPIMISVQLPSMPEKPEWKLDGSVISVPDLPVNTLFSTLRERIKRVVDADLPISRLRLDYNGKVMTNNATMASVNLDEDDTLVLSVRKK